ncbi:MAG: hypothetical protein GXP54_02010 [Deltaproteobacteria bacterium]|nr:hypothetical protein [Deltaproteobacteria bacterium]
MRTKFFAATILMGLACGCLSAQKKSPDDVNVGTDAADTGKDATLPPPDIKGWDPGILPQDSGPDHSYKDNPVQSDHMGDVGGSDLHDAGCADFRILSFSAAGGLKYAVFDQQVDITANVESSGPAPSVQVDFQPASLSAYWHDTGNGNGWFRQTAADEKFATTEVTLKLKVTGGGCTDEATYAFKVLGSVWAAEYGGDVVQVFRSDGQFIVQGIPTTFLNDPWSLIQLAPDRIGVGNRHKDGVEIYDLDGTHVGAFDIVDDKGSNLYSIYGAYALMRHQPDGKIWVAGPRGKLLIYEPDGTFLDYVYLDIYPAGELQGEDLFQLPDQTSVIVGDKTLSWDMYLLDIDGKPVGKWGDNSQELQLKVYRAASIAGGGVAVSGKVGLAINKAVLAILKPGGQMVKQSAPVPDFLQSYDILPFGDGYLVSTDQGSIARFDADLNLVTSSWTGAKEGDYRGLMLLGGN